MSEEVLAVGPVRPNPAWRRAELIRRDGRLECRCPYACLATCEPCTFKDVFDRAVEGTWKGLATGEIEDEELSRIFLGSALGPEFYDPSTQADTL